MTGFKFKNYISYAIGEIILVVIGILIAVGINNRFQSKMNNTLVLLEKRLEED